MRNFFTLSILLIAVIFNHERISAQCNPNQCATPMPAVDVLDACILPSPSSLDCYYGATTPDPPVNFPPWCGVIHNNHWFAFTADAATATFDISVFGCAVGNGLQAAVFSTTDCIDFTLTSNCLGNIPTQTTATLNANGLTPGEVYYLCIDGSSGAECDYAINGSLPTVNGPVDGICIPSSPAAVYTTNANSVWNISPPSAGNIIGSNIGVAVNVVWLEPGPAQICAKSLQCLDAPDFCLDVIVGEDVSSVEHVNMCQGYSVECAGNTYSQAGSFMVNLPTYLNCDSIVNCVVHLIPTVFSTETVNICQGGTATCAGEEFLSPGTYPVKLSAYQGCDSIVNCKVVLVPTYNSPTKFVTLCGPASYDVCDNTYTTSGIYAEVCKGYLGCDSIINTDLAILEPVAVIAPPAVIDCGSNSIITLNGTGSNINNSNGGTTLYQWSGPGIVGFSNQPNVQVNQPGQYCLVLTHGRAGTLCRDTACVTVTAVTAVPGLPQIAGNTLPCGDSTVIYTATANGNPAPTSFVWTIPGNLSYTNLGLGSIQITWDTVVSGTLCVTANNSCGASQPACLPLTVQPPIQQPVMSGPATVCAGGGNYNFILDLQQTGVNYNWSVPPGAVFSGSGDTVSVNFLNAASGQVCVTPQNSCGTGTPVCRNVSVSPIPSADLSSSTELCAGESANLNFALTGNGPFDVTWEINGAPATLNDITNGHTVNVSPTQTSTYKITNVSDNSAPACALAVSDSVTVTVWQHSFATATAQICEGQTFFVGGASQTVSGVYTDSLNTVHGCDSVIVTTLTVFQIDSLVVSSSTCDPSLAGTNTQVFQQLNGCDSVVVSTVVLNPSNTTLLFDKSCILGNTGVFTQNLSNVYGCDSTVITTVTFSLSDTTYLAASSCDPTQVGTFFNNLVTTDGCDSLIITTVSQLPIDLVNTTGTTCNPAQVGVFPTVLSNQFGCDSTVVLTVSLAPLPITFLTATTCDPAAVGVFNNTIVTTAGCDSTVSTTVTLLPSSATALSATTCNTSQVGVFPTVLPNQFGCDSTITLTVSFVPLPNTLLTAATCDPAAVGVFPVTLVTAAGCDSTVITTVNLLPSSATTVNLTSCDPAQVGTVVTVKPNQFGCDSTITTITSLLPSSATTVNLTTCNAAQAGTVVTVKPNQFGCDSTITTITTLLPSSSTTVNLTTCDAAQVGSVVTVKPNQFGCDSTITTVTTLLPANNCSVAAAATGSNIPCGSTTGTVTLTATVGTAPFSYTVTQGAVTVATGTLTALNTPQAVTGLPAGSYTINIGSPNGFGTSVQATVVQLAPPGLSSTASSDYAGFNVSCNGETDGQASATATGGLAPFSYAWSSGATAQVADNLVAGSYTVTVTDANGCTNTSSVTLSEPEALDISLTVNDLDCFGNDFGAIQVNATGGAQPYKYAINSGTAQSSNLFSGLNAGAYTLVATDANGCQENGIIVVNAAFEMQVELGDDIKISLGDSAYIQALVNVPADSILSIVWTPPLTDAECPDPCLGQVVVPFVSTVYSVQVQALNGCTDEDQVTVIVDRRKQVYIPNIFSPNDDGVNDLLNVFAKPGTVSKIISMQIFDRWGESLYRLNDFLPNSPTIGWDGSFKGARMNPGVYVWVAEIEFIDGQKEVYKGDVTIVR